MEAKYKKYLGFTLVELMAALAVVMILVALALPRFRVFIARGRQGEAVQNLGVIVKLQRAFRLRHQGLGDDRLYHVGMSMGLGAPGSGGTCADDATGTKNTLGFRVPDCDRLRYTYTSIMLPAVVGFAASEGVGNRLIYPNCTGITDSWIVDEGGRLTNTMDIVQSCKN